MGLRPDGPVEELLIRELAMFRARLSRLEAAEFALLAADIEQDPNDSRELAAGYVNNSEALERLQKAETHLRRAYNRTWDRLERMQKERHKMPLNEALKQSHIHATYEAERLNRPQDIPALHPTLKQARNERSELMGREDNTSPSPFESNSRFDINPQSPNDTHRS